jgi:MFS family permease
MIHNHGFFWRFIPRKELTQIYLSLVLRNFTVSLLSLFVPIYLHIELGYTLHETFLFFIFYALVLAITTPLAAKFASRFGVKHTVLLSIPLYLGYVSLLYLLSVYSFSLIFVSSLLGMSIAFYWTGMHLIFFHASHKSHRGEEIGKRTGSSVIAAMFGPLLGGFLIKFVGFWSVFALGALVLMLSAFILFFSKEEYAKYHFSIRSIVDRDHWKNSLFFMSRGSRVMANSVIWPLFIFVILDDYVSLGIVGFILSGVGALLIIFVGKYSDHVSKSKILHVITFFESLSWFLRAMVQTVTHVFGATIFGALTFGVREAPMSALEYDKARKRNPSSYFVTREIFICLGRILLLTFVIMTDSLSGGLIFNGVINFAAFLF